MVYFQGRPVSFRGGYITWYFKQPSFSGCFYRMIPNLYTKNGCFTKLYSLEVWQLAPENRSGSKRKGSLSHHHFPGAMLNFRGVYHKKIKQKCFGIQKLLNTWDLMGCLEMFSKWKPRCAKDLTHIHMIYKCTQIIGWGGVRKVYLPNIFRFFRLHNHSN